VVTDAIALHYTTSDLRKDVSAILGVWHTCGLPLKLNPAEFRELFGLVVDAEVHFETFDTNSDGCVDVFEVLMVYIALAKGDFEEKLRCAVSVFDFGGTNDLGYDEVALLLAATARGVHKVLAAAVADVDDRDIQNFAASLFDRYRLLPSEGARVTLDQFTVWARGDHQVKSYLETLQGAFSLSDVHARLQKLDQQMSICFNSLRPQKGKVMARDIRGSAQFVQSLGSYPRVDVSELVDIMDREHSGWVTLDNFLGALRPFFAFNMLDIDDSGTLSVHELGTLIWFQARMKPDPATLREFVRTIDEDASGTVSRVEWIKAVVEEKV